jgi:hypothetical protein
MVADDFMKSKMLTNVLREVLTRVSQPMLR